MIASYTPGDGSPIPVIEVTKRGFLDGAVQVRCVESSAKMLLEDVFYGALDAAGQNPAGYARALNRSIARLVECKSDNTSSGQVSVSPASARLLQMFPPASEIDFVKLSDADDKSHRPFFRAVPTTFARKFVLEFAPPSEQRSRLVNEMVGLHGAVVAGVKAVKAHVDEVNARVSGTFEQRSELTGTGISVDLANAEPVTGQAVVEGPRRAESPPHPTLVQTTTNNTHTVNTYTSNNSLDSVDDTMHRMITMSNNINQTNPLLSVITKAFGDVAEARVRQMNVETEQRRLDLEQERGAKRARNEASHAHSLEMERLKREQASKRNELERICFTAEALSRSGGMDRHAVKTIQSRLLAVDDPDFQCEHSIAISQVLDRGSGRSTVLEWFTKSFPGAELDKETLSDLREQIYHKVRQIFGNQAASFADAERRAEGRAKARTFNTDELRRVNFLFLHAHAKAAATTA